MLSTPTEANIMVGIPLSVPYPLCCSRMIDGIVTAGEVAASMYPNIIEGMSGISNRKCAVKTIEITSAVVERKPRLVKIPTDCRRAFDFTLTPHRIKIKMNAIWRSEWSQAESICQNSAKASIFLIKIPDNNMPKQPVISIDIECSRSLDRISDAR